MRTQAKFYVSGLTLLPGQQSGIKVNLSAVCRGDRNASWATATPSGSMEMLIQNPAAVRVWEDFMQSARATGKSPELFIDIYPSTDGWPGDGHEFRPSEGGTGIYGPDRCGACGLSKDQTLGQDKEPSHPNG